jgi:hypothetical protein
MPPHAEIRVVPAAGTWAGGTSMIRFSCPRCLCLLEALDRDAGGQRTCPRCQQRLEIPGPPQAPIVTATVAPIHGRSSPTPAQTPSVPSLTLTLAPALDKQKLEQLGRLQWATLPGYVLAWFAFPTLIAIVMVFLFLLFQQGINGWSWPGYTWSVVAVGWVGGLVGTVLLINRLNEHFVKKNTIRLRFSMQPDKQFRYVRLLRSLDDLASTAMCELLPCGANVYDRGLPVRFRVQLPRYLRCNYDVYCLAVGRDRYYLLPDCVLISTDERFFTAPYTRVSVAVNPIRGFVNNTVFDYHWLHPRVDGGPDRRYKHNYQIPVPRKVPVPLDRYGVMAFHVGRDEVVVLADHSRALAAFDVAFRDWLKGQ